MYIYMVYIYLLYRRAHQCHSDSKSKILSSLSQNGGSKGRI